MSLEPSDSWATDLKFAQASNGGGYQDTDQENQLQQEVLLEFDLEERTREATIREQEVGHIVQSISDLNHIFKVCLSTKLSSFTTKSRKEYIKKSISICFYIQDLAHMVQDQGSILDRIDYNVEQTQAQVQEGYKQLKKADSYQRANRKLYCIMVLTAAIIFLSFFFIVFKT